MGQFAQRAGAFFKVDAGMRGNALDVDAPVARALARGLAGQALRWFEHQYGRAVLRQPFGDGTRNRAADLFFAVEQQDDFAVEKIGFGEHFDGREGHGDSGLHVQRAGTPQASVAHAAGHGLERAHRPHGIDMPQQQDGAVSFAARSEADLDHVAECALPMQFDAAARGHSPGRDQRSAGIHRSLVIGGRLGADQRLDQSKKRGLLAARPREQSAHGDGRVERSRVLRSVQGVSSGQQQTLRFYDS